MSGFVQPYNVGRLREGEAYRLTRLGSIRLRIKPIWTVIGILWLPILLIFPNLSIFIARLSRDVQAQLFFSIYES